MTKAQKSLFKALKTNAHRDSFVEMLMSQQDVMGKYSHWAPAYGRKCLKKGTKPPFKMDKTKKAS